MRLTKECYIHNHLFFDETERNALVCTSKIITDIHDANVHIADEEDTYLTDLCTNVLMGIRELLDNYSNEYVRK